MTRNFLIFIFFICLFGSLNAKNLFPAQADTAQYLKNPNYKYEIALYETYKTKQADIVMLGNSITHGANWNQLLGRNDVIEMGIPSDIVEGMLNRLNFVYELEPKIVFILGGINDIYSWIPLETIMVNYIQIVKNLQARGIKPVIQSVLYAGELWPASAERNTQVTKFNNMLKQFADKNGITYVDLNKTMSKGTFLRPEYSRDALHLNAKGFHAWVKEIENVLLNAGI